MPVGTTLVRGEKLDRVEIQPRQPFYKLARTVAQYSLESQLPTRRVECADPDLNKDAKGVRLFPGCEADRIQRELQHTIQSLVAGLDQRIGPGNIGAPRLAPVDDLEGTPSATGERLGHGVP